MIGPIRVRRGLRVPCMNDVLFISTVPLDVEHSLIWTKVPILPLPSLLTPHVAAALAPDLQAKISARLAQDGLWGFTGATELPPDPSLLPENLGALGEWGVTMDKLIISPKGSPEEEEAVKQSGAEVQNFITRRWTEREWETCWFVNPPVSRAKFSFFAVRFGC